jgi:hypothetical protein
MYTEYKEPQNTVIVSTRHNHLKKNQQNQPIVVRQDLPEWYFSPIDHRPR